MLQQLDFQLKRVAASDVVVEFDDEFDSNVGRLVKITYAGTFWHLLPGELEELLTELPDNAGGDAIRQAIESKARVVWHGPSPEGSRDTTN